MNKEINRAISIVLPNKKVNLFVISGIIVGLACGAIFLSLLSSGDKNLVVTKIRDFMESIHNNTLDSGLAFKNALIINFSYIILIWLLGFSIIGLVINFIANYFKSFILGFTLSSLSYTYHFKGIVAVFIYTIPTQIINIGVYLILGVYTIMMTNMLIKTIFKKQQNLKGFFKKYVLILGIVSVMALISSLCEAFILPWFLKIVIKLFV